MESAGPSKRAGTLSVDAQLRCYGCGRSLIRCYRLVEFVSVRERLLVVRSLIRCYRSVEGLLVWWNVY